MTAPLLTPTAEGTRGLGPKPEAEATLVGLVTELAQELRGSGHRIAVGRESALDRELGIDSLARIELLLRIEGRNGLRFRRGLFLQRAHEAWIRQAAHFVGNRHA